MIYLMTGLRQLCIAGCHQITDQSLIVIAQHCPQLELIDISSCRLVTDQAIIALARNCKKLRHISAPNCLKITDTSLSALGHEAHNLSHLNVECCDYITDNGVIDMVKGATKLKALNLRGCNELTAVCVPAIVENLKMLVSLDISMSGVVPSQLIQAAVVLPFAVKGEGSNLVPLPATVRKFNGWLINYRKEVKGANTIQQLILRFLGRRRYRHMRRRLESLALRIQRVFRGHNGRELAHWMKHKQLHGNRAALKIQCMIRGKISRKRAAAIRQIRQERQTRARRIQAIVRGYVCQQRWRRYLRRQHRIKQRWHRLADTMLRRRRKRIQRYAIFRIEHFYGIHKRRRIKNASTLIQRIWRGHSVRVKVWDGKCARLFATNRAATIINNACRNRLRRKRWKSRLEAIELDFRIMRENHKYCTAAATKIQRFYRRAMDRWRLKAKSALLKEKYRKKCAAAVVMQCMVRCRLARKALRRKRIEKIAHRVAIYEKWRALAKNLFHAKARRIQRWWRKKQLKFKSARLIQKTYRGHLARRRFVQLKRKWTTQWWLRTCAVIR